MNDPAPALEFADLTVQFGATKAVDGVSLTIRPGEIVGLLGHNGAGKSTVINVTSGAVAWTGGSFAIDGEAIVRGTSPRELADKGVTVVHQEPALAKNLSVLDNLTLARKPEGSRAEQRARAAEALAGVGAAHIDLEAPVGALTLGERQLVDLARGRLGGAIKLLLLDEPTAALGAKETEELHALIRDFAAAGTAVVYVSHRLPDILEVCRRIVVLASGRLVMDRPAEGLALAELAEALAPGVAREAIVARTGAPERLAFHHGDVRLTAGEGEVVGLFGMAAGEQFGLLSSLFGLGGLDEATLDGAPYSPRRPADALAAGVHLVPADRETEGLIGGLSARANELLPWYGRTLSGAWITAKTGADVYDASRAALQIQGPDGDAAIAEFSGGNRQKHLLARWMFPKQARVLLLAQPTQGVDVGAKADIVRGVRALAAQGVTVLVASAESDEIASMCDRSYVVLGSHVGEIPRTDDFDAALLATLLDLADAR